MAYTMCFFPWIGAVIGALTWAVGIYGPKAGLNPSFLAVILTLIPWLVTGGIHLDGLLDTADAMSSWQEKEKRLEILKDSRAGAFAVISCVVYFLFYYGVYCQATPRAFPLIGLSFLLSRSLSALAVVTFPKASAKGSAAAMARGASSRRVIWVNVVYLILLFAGMMLLDWKPGLVCYAAALITFGAYHHYACKYFGGITGDLAGCFLSLCELFCTAAAALAVLIL